MSTACATSTDEFTQLVTTHRRRLEAAAYRVTRDHALAEDAVSVAFARVWRRWEAADIDDPASYLARAVHNAAIDTIRRRERERTALHRAFERPDDRTVEHHVENRQVVDDLIRALPDHHRHVVALRFLEDLTVTETSAALAVPPGTVKSTTSRGLASLRRLTSAH